MVRRPQQNRNDMYLDFQFFTSRNISLTSLRLPGVQVSAPTSLMTDEDYDDDDDDDDDEADFFFFKFLEYGIYLTYTYRSYQPKSPQPRA